MSDYFIDDLMIITPLGHAPGIRLFGQVTGAHAVPLTRALIRCRGQHKDVTVDLTGIDYLSHSALETLVDAARDLPSSLHLTLRARPELRLAARFAARGWHEIPGLHLSEDCAPARMVAPTA
ncbi:STAS domain-containing protein [Streptomyces sp. NPDC059785]|uniref:STAS domain-containing protein n=1 Tax=Streptomyces sp. NPDC059785 TaxID=3346945 RepID=UPI0036559840